MKSNITYCDCCGSVIKSYYYTADFQPAYVDATDEDNTTSILMKLSGVSDSDPKDICETCWKVMMHFLNLRAEEVRPLHDLINYLEDDNIEEGEVKE